jgi:hypothetical protein
MTQKKWGVSTEVFNFKDWTGQSWPVTSLLCVSKYLPKMGVSRKKKKWEESSQHFGEKPNTKTTEHSDRDWIAANAGRVKYDSLRILGLREKEQPKEK